MDTEKILEKLESEYPELRKEPLMEDLRMSLGDEEDMEDEYSEEEDMFADEEMPEEGDDLGEEDPLAYLGEEDDEEEEEDEDLF